MVSKPKKKRLDVLLVDRGLSETRTKAQALILSGRVFSNEQRLDKAGMSVSEDIEVTIKEQLQYVGRGGLKLEAALNHFQINPENKNCLDIGASTGGFTDCLLQRGALHVTAVDAGHGQIDWKLRQDSRVDIREKTNARYLQPSDFSLKFDIVVIDVSFISLTKILPVVPPLINQEAMVIALIKPQFEVGREEVGKGGIVRDPVAQQRALNNILKFAGTINLQSLGSIDSPILGADGNREFLACFHLS